MSESDFVLEGRVCNSCGKLKSWDDFDKKKDGKNGHHSQCKECVARRKRSWWKKKKVKKRIRPTVLEFSNSDIFETTVRFSGTQKAELEKILRSMVFDSFA